MLGDCRGRRKGSEIIGFAGQAADALSCSLLFGGTSGNPAAAPDASEMTVPTHRLDHSTGPSLPRRRLVAVAFAIAAALSLGGCDAFTQVYQRGSVPAEGALEQVPLGATQEQVLIVLGTPSTVATVSGEAFYYISQRAARAVTFMPASIVD